MTKRDLYNVYYIAETGTPNAKIGVAANPHQRLRELQTGNPRQLVLRAVIPGFSHLDAAISAERELHEKYDHYRLRGEWFLDADGQIFEFFKVTGAIVTNNRKRGRPKKNQAPKFSASFKEVHPRVLAKFDRLVGQVGLVEATRRIDLARMLSISRIDADVLRAVGEERINRAMTFAATAQAVQAGNYYGETPTNVH